MAQKTFEQSMKQIERIVQELEEGDLPFRVRARLVGVVAQQQDEVQRLIAVAAVEVRKPCLTASASPGCSSSPSSSRSAAVPESPSIQMWMLPSPGDVPTIGAVRKRRFGSALLDPPTE